MEHSRFPSIHTVINTDQNWKRKEKKKKGRKIHEKTSFSSCNWICKKWFVPRTR